MSSPSKRRDSDLMKLMMSDYQVSMGESDSARDFYVKFHGPKDSPYFGGIWKIHVTLPAEYPYKSPSIGFCNRIYHPNVDEASGSVCLDVINQTWSPMFDLLNIFESFLPQLLLYPNAADPLNGEAAALYMQDKKAFHNRVVDYVKRFSSEDINLDEEEEDNTTESMEEEVLSDIDDEEAELGMAADMEL